MTVYNRTTRSEVRFAKVTGSKGEGSKVVTLGDVEAFVHAAKSEGIPLDTAVESSPSISFMCTTHLPYLQVQATVEEEGRG